MSDLSSRLAQLTPEQRARLAARVVAERSTERETERETLHAAAHADDTIAIVGMGCRLPGGVRSPAEFWELLARGADAVTPVPPARWDGDAFFDPDADVPGRIGSREGAFVDGVDEFDAEYFGISPFEARQMDPQQRLLLEVAIEALEDAGLTRDQLAGSACGVFVGVHSHSSDYYLMQVAALNEVDTYTSTGTAHSVLANRLSYFLDLRGPSMAIDTACSSSLVAFHQACLSLRARESTIAVAAGVNLMLSPDGSVALTKLRVLSPRGRCRTFDASADGIVRGEGCVAVVLKRAADAVRDGDSILALVRGTAVNQDGATNGLTAPNAQSQVAVIQSALAVARLAPDRVTFVETHGTGTALGDPIEIDAIAATYGAPRPRGGAVVLGALKTNIGHLEGAAGLAGVIKTVLCLQHRTIPPNLHLTTLNPLVQLDGTSIELATTLRNWTPVTGTRVGAVSAFGFGGTNAHAIIEEAPEGPTAATPIDDVVAAQDSLGDGQALPLVISAHTDAALRAQVAKWRTFLPAGHAAEHAADIAYTAAVRRTHHAHRVAVVGRDIVDWCDRLDAWSRLRGSGLDDTLAPLAHGERRKVAFVFCGQGPQWFAMGRELAATEPLFRDVLSRVDAVVQRVAGWSLLDELRHDEASTRIHETEFTQPAIFAIQMGLVSVWRAWGGEPDFVIGHSMGEIAAACTAGALDLDEGARIAIFRGRAVSRAEGLGSMVSFPISAARASQVIAGIEDRVGIAAINAPASVVLAGDAEALATVSASLRDDGIEGRTLEVRYASHSPQMDPLVAWLQDALGAVTHRAPTLPMFSSISHELVKHATFDAAHWARGLRRPVDFAGGVQAALAAGCRTFVDIAPHPVMAPYVRETAEAEATDVLAVASLRRQASEREQLLQSASELFMAGVDLRWDSVLGRRGVVRALPSYAWQHGRYWINTTTGRAPQQTRRALSASSSASSSAVPSAPTPADAPVQEPLLHRLRWTADDAAHLVSTRTVQRWAVLGGDAALAQGLVQRLRRGDVDAVMFPAHDPAGAVNLVTEQGGEIIDLRATQPDTSASVLSPAVSAASALQTVLSGADGHAHAAPQSVRVWCVTRGAQVTDAPSTDARSAKPASPKPASPETASPETASAEPTSPNTTWPDAVQAAVWGIGRVAAIEMPERWGGLVDLDPGVDVAQQTEDLLHAVSSASEELESVYRGGQRLVPRLVPASVNDRALTLSRDGSYLVTGGLGGVGLVVAEWLASRGAARIVLLGRTALPPRAQWDDPDLSDQQRGRIDAVRRIESRGAEIRTAALDVSNTTALQQLRFDLLQTDWGPVRGILHGAMDQQFGLLQSMDDEALEAMMRSKIGGAEALWSTFGDDRPDFMVLFSSLAALLGERGQGAYAASNTVLDAWTTRRRLEGAPVSVVNWGAWDNTGLAGTRGGALVTEGLRARGVLPVAPVDATRALGNVLMHGLSHVAVFRVAPEAPVVTGRDPWRALATLQRRTADGASVVPANTRSLRDEVNTLSTARERLARLTTLVRDVVSDTLGITESTIDAHQPLGALGMDSLMAIRIRRRCERMFELGLPATALFSYPTIAAFAQFLSERLADSGAAAEPAARTTSPTRDEPMSSDAVNRTGSGDSVDKVNVLSEEEALATLRSRPTSRRRTT